MTVVVVVSALFVLWAGYRFPTTQLTTEEDHPHSALDERIGGEEGWLRDAAYAAAEFPLPALPQYMQGIRDVIRKKWNPGGSAEYPRTQSL